MEGRGSGGVGSVPEGRGPGAGSIHVQKQAHVYCMYECMDKLRRQSSREVVTGAECKHKDSAPSMAW